MFTVTNETNGLNNGFKEKNEVNCHYCCVVIVYPLAPCVH